MHRRIAAAAFFLLTAASTSFAYRNAAWIPPWDGNALTSMQMNAGALNESNPVWYSWNADGTIAKNWNAENNTWRAAMTGTIVVPTVQNVVNKKFDGAVAATVLATPASRETHASAIAQLAITNAFDGIDIDYERVPTTSRANFTAFLGTLGQKLHAANKKLSVTVYAKTSDRANWNGPGAEDWPAIGTIADSVKIMAYDYHESSSGAGAITPLDWLDQVATYAESVLPRSKIMIGLPWYGYDWASDGRVTTMSYTAATLLARNNGATVSRDVNGEPTFTFPGHTVFFQDAESYARKVELLKQRHSSIGGFAAWSAGVEDPAIWSVIRGASATTPARPAPAADFSVSGPASLVVTQGSTTTGDYRLVPANGFNAAATVTLLPPLGFNGSLIADSPMVNAGASVTVRIAATSATAPGVYQFGVRFTSNGLQHEQAVSLRVNAAARRRAVR